MCELALGAQYDLVMVPFYIFNYLLTEEAQNAALERIHTHVSPQGRLLIDVFIPVSRIAYCPPKPVLKVDTVDSRTGHRVRGWNIYAIDTERQIEHRRHIFEIAQPDGTVQQRVFTTHRRYFIPSELEALFSSSEFSVEDIFSGYERELPDANSEQLLYVLKHR
jgi:hypothetical protein